MNIDELIKNRRSTQTFIQNRKISRQDIEKIIELATYSPSSRNIQNWHFLVVDDSKQKILLKEAAYGQEKIEDASVAIVVLGNLNAAEFSERTVDDSISKGYMPEERRSSAIEGTIKAYDDPEKQKIEALRSATLASMTLMIAAEGMGYNTCPMGGFSPEKVRQSFNIPDKYVPILIITLGYAAEDSRPRKGRIPVTDVLTYNEF